MRKLMLYIATLLLLVGCTQRKGFHTHEFVPQNSQIYYNESMYWAFADLKGDGYEHLISTGKELSSSYILVQNQLGKTISQISIPQHRIWGLNSLVDKRDNSRWLFVTHNDGLSVGLSGATYDWKLPLGRTMRSFTPLSRNDHLMGIAAYTWTANLYPHHLDDIDADGKLDLVCAALDGYSANPRGIVVYDFDTGALKWFFHSPTCFTSVLLDDFDNDGKKELVLGNNAMKNTMALYNGLTDQDGWITILDAEGKALHIEKMFDGYGEVRLRSADTDQDGTKDIFAILMTRGSEDIPNSILRFKYSGGRLVRVKEFSFAGTFGEGSPVEFLQKMDISTRYNILVVDKSKGLLRLDDQLNLLPSYENEDVKFVSQIFDIDADGKKEVLVRSDSDDFVVLNHDLKPTAKLKNPFPEQVQTRLFAVQTGFGNPPQLAIGSEKGIRYYHYTPIPFYLYLLRLIDTYSLYLVFLLTIILFVMISFTNRRRRAFKLIMNSQNEGFLMLSSRKRIFFANSMAINLAIELNPKADLHNLPSSFPEIYDVLGISLKNSTESEIFKLQLGNIDAEFTISILKLKGLIFKYGIIISPKQEVRNSEKLQWADIARRLSHHVRRHITNVVLALDPVENDISEASQEYLEIVKSEIDKIRVFTHAFQRFTEMRDYELKLQDLNPSVEHALSQVKLPPNVKLIRNFGLKSVNAYIEPIRFEEALINTFNNATEAMPNGGSLHITLRDFPKHKSPKGNLSILVEIEDTGKGIPAKYMDDIWKPFFTTNQSGTGIGIPETRKIIDSMGGYMDIQSEEGVGTTVSLWLKGSGDV